MLILHETHHKPQAGNRRMPANSVRWIISLICLLIIFAAGIFVNHHQALSAGSMAVTELKPIRPSGVVPAQGMAKTVGSTDNLAVKPSIWPASGAVTSGFGWRDSPWGGGSESHPGIDIANSLGTPIVATADGQVVQSGPAGGYGNVVQIDHGNGITTIYGHNSSTIVNVGESVRKGQVIAYLGSTGKSTGPHVHYEIRINGTAVDPISFMVR